MLEWLLCSWGRLSNHVQFVSCADWHLIYRRSLNYLRRNKCHSIGHNSYYINISRKYSSSSSSRSSSSSNENNNISKSSYYYPYFYYCRFYYCELQRPMSMVWPWGQITLFIVCNSQCLKQYHFCDFADILSTKLNLDRCVWNCLIFFEDGASCHRLKLATGFFKQM